MADFTLTVLSHKHMLHTSNRWYRGLAIEITQHYNTSFNIISYSVCHLFNSSCHICSVYRWLNVSSRPLPSVATPAPTKELGYFWKYRAVLMKSVFENILFTCQSAKKKKITQIFEALVLGKHHDRRLVSIIHYLQKMSDMKLTSDVLFRTVNFLVSDKFRKKILDT